VDGEAKANGVCVNEALAVVNCMLDVAFDGGLGTPADASTNGGW
jgi:hypothetical protein